MTPFSQKVFSFLDVSLRQDLNGGKKSTKWSKFVSVSESPFLIYRQDKLDLEQQPERETEVEGQVLCRTQKVKRQDLQVNWKGLFFCFCFRENHGCTQGRFSSHYLSRWPSCGLNWLSVCWCSGSKSPWKLGLKSFSVYQFTASKFWESWELHRLCLLPFFQMSLDHFKPLRRAQNSFGYFKWDVCLRYFVSLRYTIVCLCRTPGVIEKMFSGPFQAIHCTSIFGGQAWLRYC